MSATRRPCPSAETIRLISNKWSVEILFALAEPHAVRFRELQRMLGRVTQKELTRHLRRLEQHGLVSRTAFAEVPPRVEYELTPKARELLTPLESLGRWSEQYAATKPRAPSPSTDET